MLVGSILGLGWFALFLSSHVVVFRFYRVRNRGRTILNLFLAAVSCNAISSVIASNYGEALWGPDSDSLAAASTGLFVMFSLFVLYMPFYYTVVASLSVRTIIAIQRAPGQQLPLARLTAMYVSKALLQARLDSMVNSGLLMRDGEKFRLTRKGCLIARAFRAIKKVWRLGPGG